MKKKNRSGEVNRERGSIGSDIWAKIWKKWKNEPSGYLERKNSLASKYVLRVKDNPGGHCGWNMSDIMEDEVRGQLRSAACRVLKDLVRLDFLLWWQKTIWASWAREWQDQLYMAFMYCLTFYNKCIFM